MAILAEQTLEEEVLGKAYDARLMRRLLTYMKPYKSIIAVSIFLLLIDSVFQVTGPLLTKFAIDKYLVPSQNVQFLPFLSNALSSDPWTGLTQFAGLYLGLLSSDSCSTSDRPI